MAIARTRRTGRYTKRWRLPFRTSPSCRHPSEIIFKASTIRRRRDTTAYHAVTYRCDEQLKESRLVQWLFGQSVWTWRSCIANNSKIGRIFFLRASETLDSLQCLLTEEGSKRQCFYVSIRWSARVSSEHGAFNHCWTLSPRVENPVTTVQTVSKCYNGI